jgi:competence protein CoiA
MKIEIYDALTRHPLVSHAELERPFGEVRADVFAVIDGTSVAIEVQISTLSAARIAERTRAYARLGIAVLWILAWSPEVESLAYAPAQFERWLHAAYFGRVYYWHHGLTLIPYQFHDRHLRIPAKSWYDARGKLQRSRSRTQVSQRYKVTVRGRPLHIATDFRRSRRLPWEGKHFRVPEALLYIDKRRNFERG